jgi:hypothetical protein
VNGVGAKHVTLQVGGRRLRNRNGRIQKRRKVENVNKKYRRIIMLLYWEEAYIL